MDMSEIATYWGLPAALVGLAFWFFKRYLNKRDAERSKAEEERERKALERDKHQEKLQLQVMQSLRAVTVLSTATASAVQRIPDAKCNGDMTRALQYVAEVQNQQKDFLMELGIHSIYDYD